MKQKIKISSAFRLIIWREVLTAILDHNRRDLLKLINGIIFTDSWRIKFIAIVL